MRATQESRNLYTLWRVFGEARLGTKDGSEVTAELNGCCAVSDLGAVDDAASGLTCLPACDVTLRLLFDIRKGNFTCVKGAQRGTLLRCR